MQGMIWNVQYDVFVRALIKIRCNVRVEGSFLFVLVHKGEILLIKFFADIYPF